MPRSLLIREFLTRNGHPYKFVDLDTDATGQAILDQFQVKAGDIPVVILPGPPCCAIPRSSRSPTVSG